MKRALSLLLLLGLAACGSTASPPQEPTPTSGVPGGACPELITGGESISFGPGNTLAGVVMGSGATGIVLSHQLSANLCQWAPAAKELVGNGYRVLLFDSGGFGASLDTDRLASDDVAEAAKVLRERGSSRIVLMGGSMGGAAVLVAATAITPPVTAVVAISSPALITGLDALAAAPKLSMPVLFLSAEFDVSFTRDAKSMHAAASGNAGAELHIIAGGTGHGVPLVSPAGDGEARATVAAFLAKHAGG
jgi:pimeloyl-ACP methyl ester carboxylesterase